MKALRYTTDGTRQIHLETNNEARVREHFSFLREHFPAADARMVDGEFVEIDADEHWRLP